MEKKNRYVIDKNVYEKHIDDEVHLYSMLHQLAFQAGRVKDAEDMAVLIDAAKRYGETADDLFDDWGIPGRYLVFGEKKDLAALREKELEPLSSLLAEHDVEKMSKALEQASWNLPYIIHGSSFRLLVGSIFELLARYCSMTRRIMEAKTEKDFLRLQKQVSKNSGVVRRLCRGWGVPEEPGVTCREILERAIEKEHLIPVSESDLVLVCSVEDPDGEDEGEDLDDLDDLIDPGEVWDE